LRPGFFLFDKLYIYI